MLRNKTGGWGSVVVEVGQSCHCLETGWESVGGEQLGLFCITFFLVFV